MASVSIFLKPPCFAATVKAAARFSLPWSGVRPGIADKAGLRATAKLLDILSGIVEVGNPSTVVAGVTDIVVTRRQYRRMGRHSARHKRLIARCRVGPGAQRFQVVGNLPDLIR